MTFEERLLGKAGGEAIYAEGRAGTQSRDEDGVLLIRKKTNGSRCEPNKM